MTELSAKKRRFVDEYVRCWNGAEAARRAGYSRRTAKEQAARLLTTVNVRAAIRTWIDENLMSADEVRTRLADHARGNLAPFIHQGPNGEIQLDILSQEAQQNIGLIKKLKTKRRTGGASRGQDGSPEDDGWTEIETEIELYDAQAALVHIGKMHGLFVDRSEHSGDLTLRVVYGTDDTSARAAPEAGGLQGQ